MWIIHNGAHIPFYAYHELTVIRLEKQLTAFFSLDIESEKTLFLLVYFSCSSLFPFFFLILYQPFFCQICCNNNLCSLSVSKVSGSGGRALGRSTHVILISAL